MRIKIGIAGLLAALALPWTAGCDASSDSAVVLFPATPVTQADQTLAVLPAGAAVELLGEYAAGLQVRLDDGRVGYLSKDKAAPRAWPVAVIANINLGKGEKISPPAILAVVSETGDDVEFAYGGADGKIRYATTRELAHLSAVSNDIAVSAALLEASTLDEPRRTAALKRIWAQAGDSELAPVIERILSGDKAPVPHVFPEPFLADDDDL